MQKIENPLKGAEGLENDFDSCAEVLILYDYFKKYPTKYDELKTNI